MLQSDNMQFVICFLLINVALANAMDNTLEEIRQWEEYKVKFSKSYLTKEEEIERKKIFFQNVEFVRQHNQKFERGEESFDVAINNFADMTNEEFVEKMLTFHQSEQDLAGATRTFQGPASVKDLPSSVDWRDEGAVTPVKNQGTCGSCWAFSSTGSLEGQHFLNTGELVSLSEQNLVDCAMMSFNRSGCDGGWMVNAYDYIINNTGIDTETSYPYESKDGMEGSCRFNDSTVGATMTGYVNITEGSETDLQAAVATVGPISVAIDAGHLSFQLYHSGVYKKWLCQKKHLNHAVLVVGYGTKSGIWFWDGEYWLVKNSWGTSWGEKGYILMARNRDNMCGIATLASYPLV